MAQVETYSVPQDVPLHAALMVDEERPYYAHPMFRAPFIVVGEGGVGTANMQGPR